MLPPLPLSFKPPSLWPRSLHQKRLHSSFVLFKIAIVCFQPVIDLCCTANGTMIPNMMNILLHGMSDTTRSTTSREAEQPRLCRKTNIDTYILTF